MKILAIETSCDETSAAVIGEHLGGPIILSNVVSSQIDIHKKYGGVVPEVAARAHIESIIPVISESLSLAGVSLSEIDRLAPATAPGLVGSLIVGVETAKAISLSRNIPIFPVNHLEGHIYASFAQITHESHKQDLFEPPSFPLLALLVSGGNTLIILMTDHGKYEVVGRTRDDAAGEAFDKVAKCLDLPYPGGPAISQAAKRGNPEAFSFPIADLTEAPRKDQSGFLIKAEPSLDFSFSGLKTAVAYEVKKLRGRSLLGNKAIYDISASFQEAAVGALVNNTEKALRRFPTKSFVLAGGVAANKRLRDALKDLISKKFKNVKFFIPPIDLCTDNAGMIGVAAYYKKSPINDAAQVSANPTKAL